jgi:hypothetical protein
MPGREGACRRERNQPQDCVDKQDDRALTGSRFTLPDWFSFTPLTFLAIACALVMVDPGVAGGAERSRDLGVRAVAEEWGATGRPYFVDFRGRAGYFFGHTFIVYGRLDAEGRAREVRYAGIYPTDDELGLIVGMVVPVPASVRGVDGDIKEPATNVYRRRLTASQYARLEAAIDRVARSERHWNLLTYNCNDFAINIAGALNMHTP